jgi:hypothetical protein
VLLSAPRFRVSADQLGVLVEATAGAAAAVSSRLGGV